MPCWPSPARVLPSCANWQARAEPRGDAYMALHVTDLYKLGLMRPEQFDITYKNFPMEGNMHGLIGYLKQWMQDNNFITYTLQSLNDKMVRGYFLRDAQEQQDPDCQDAALHPIPAAGPAGPATHLPAGRLLGLQDSRQQGTCPRTIRSTIHFAPAQSAPVPAQSAAQD